MNIHEFQAKRILQLYGIPITDFFVISTLNELEEILSHNSLTSAVLKIQIHAGGRGKAGGVLFAKTPNEIRAAAKKLLNETYYNEQTGPLGLKAHQLLLSPPVDIAKEFYIGVTINREKAQSVLIASPIGGMDIEKVAKEQPDKVLVLAIPPEGAFRSYQLLRISKFMGWRGEIAKQGGKLIQSLVKAAHETDSILLEINPLVLTHQDQLIALDAKLVVDDNALFRQEELREMFDPTQVSSNEARAIAEDLAYVGLDGNIGCMVNGAGLAMATMDIIEHYGGRPANFLDVGGSASKEKVAEGFKIILSDLNVKVILVNIFGGIMNCETLAQGIIEAANELDLHVPLVIRMEGTNVQQGKELLNHSGLNFIIAEHLADAAEQAVKFLK